MPFLVGIALEALVCLHNWPMAEILGDSLAGIMPDSVSVWWSLARARAQLGKREVALEAVAWVTAPPLTVVVAVALMPPPPLIVTEGALV